jgi:hypothetical protein
MLEDWSDGSLHSTTTDTTLATQLHQISTTPTSKLYQIPTLTRALYLSLKRKVGETSKKLELLSMPIKDILTILTTFNFQHNSNLILFGDALNRELMQ